ncbi:MAG: hypothetical protein RLY92_812 [Chloroflexota bacterium]
MGAGWVQFRRAATPLKDKLAAAFKRTALRLPPRKRARLQLIRLLQALHQPDSAAQARFIWVRLRAGRLRLPRTQARPQRQHGQPNTIQDNATSAHSHRSAQHILVC